MYSQSYKSYITIILLAAYVLNQTDRAIFGFLMEPIKQEFGLSDTQLGFLGGPAFVLLYTLLGVPISRWADRSHRVNIMSVAIAVWSAIAMLTAAAGSFSQLAIVRIGVGIGEAGFSAIAISVIGDYHDDDERTRAVARLMLGIPIAGVLTNLMAGWVSEMFGWRAMFIVAGLPGIFLALLMKCTVREPARRVGLQAPHTPNEHPPLRSVLLALWQQRTLRYLIIAQALANVVACAASWSAIFFIRHHHVSLGELGVWLAMVSAVGGAGGIWFSGYLVSRFGACDPRVGLKFMSFAAALSVPMVALALWAPTKELAILALLLSQFPLVFFLGPTQSLVQEFAAASMRATMASMFILIQVVAGGIVGNQVVGLLSDYFSQVTGSAALGLRWSIATLAMLGFVAAMYFSKAQRFVQQELQREVSVTDPDVSPDSDLATVPGAVSRPP